MQKQILYPVSPRREDHLMGRGKSLGLATPSLKRERVWLPKLREKQNRNAKSGKSKKRNAKWKMRKQKAKCEMR